MKDNVEAYKDLPKEKFELANAGKRITDTKFEDKPIGYFKDAWIRFRKNKASIVAAIIIVIIFLFAFLTPLFTFKYDSSFMDTYYAKKGPRNLTLAKIGIADGTSTQSFSDKSLLKAIAIGIGAENYDGRGVTYSEGMESNYQPVKKIGKTTMQFDPSSNSDKPYYKADVDTYLNVGFLYTQIEQTEYKRIQDWEKETGVHVLYPLIEDNEYNAKADDANSWYKSKRNNPVHINESGKAVTLSYDDIRSGAAILEDNYMRDADGKLVYGKLTAAAILIRLRLRCACFIIIFIGINMALSRSIFSERTVKDMILLSEWQGRR